MRVTLLPLQLQALVGDHWRRLAVLLVLVGVVAAGAAGWHAATPAYETETDRADVESVATGVDTSAVVTGDSSLYDRGTRLEGESVYLLGAAPELTLHGRADVPPDRRVVVSQRLLVSYEAVRGDAVFWRDNRTVASDRTVVTNGTARLDGTLDVPAVRDRLDDIGAELGDAGSARARVVHVVTYRTPQYEHALTGSAPLRISRQSYAVEGSLAADREHATETSTRSLATSGLLATSVAGHPVVVDGAALGGLLVAVLAWAGAALTRRYGPRVDADAVQERVRSERYREWISAGTLPPTGGRTLVAMDSLGDLVDVAIDARKRVVHDRARDVYAVFDGEYVYCYAHDRLAADERDEAPADAPPGPDPRSRPFADGSGVARRPDPPESGFRWGDDADGSDEDASAIDEDADADGAGFYWPNGDD